MELQRFRSPRRLATMVATIVPTTTPQHARGDAGGRPEHGHALGREQGKTQFCRQDIEPADHDGEPDRRAYPPCRRRGAERRDESALFQLIELHSVPASQGRRQDIELARSSQRGIHAYSRSDVDCAIARKADYEGFPPGLSWITSSVSGGQLVHV